MLQKMGIFFNLPGFTQHDYTETTDISLLSAFASDVDECSLNEHDCNADSLCLNTAGGFRCVCPPGLTGDGYNCTGTAT